MKELWFPILRSFADLMMEKNEEVSNDALANFKLILQRFHGVFSEQMWREVLS